MTPEQKQLVQTSWAKVGPIAPQAAELFYGRLFELDPSLKVLFKGDMQAQGAKLIQAISLVVRSLDHFSSMLSALRALGQRHVDYGVQPAHYDTVGAALLWTLEQGLGADFTAETETAWAEAYGIVASVMKDTREVSVAA